MVASHRLFGSHPLRLDEKDRLTIPSKLLAQMREMEGISEGQTLEVVIAIVKKRLGIFPRKVFMRMLENMESIPRTNATANALRKSILNYMDEQSLDKLNRVRIPAMHAQLFGLQNDIVVMGSGTHLEVVNRDAWMKQAPESMEAMPDIDEYLD